MNSRIKKLRAKLKEENIDGLIVSKQANISYLLNFTSRDSYLLISKKKNIYFTDSRYIEEVKDELKDCAIKQNDSSVLKIIADTCNSLGLKRIGFEERYMPFAEYNKIKERLNKKTELIPTRNLTEEERQIKNEWELENIKQAIAITAGALNFIKDFISAGKREIEIAAELERFIRYNGATSSSFGVIVASGPNSSYPHHITSRRIIRDNEPVLIDLGVNFNGYKSDLTRMFFLGKINSLYRKIYEIVREAQGRAIKKIKPDINISRIDAAARQFIAQKGYAKFFGHALGHGIGLEVHEEPRISRKENNKLKVGMVVTIEPGIYLPEKFGIRIEDMVLVTQKGCEVLSGSLNK
jgi:Xaa-Pro aminopeptidase